MEMELEYELTKQDYIDFNIYHARNSDTIKKTLFIQRYITPIIFLMIPFVLVNISEIPLWYWFIAFSITIIIWIVFYPKYFMSVIIKRTSKMVDEGKNKDLLGKHSFVISEEGLVDKSKNGETKISWDGVEKIVSTETHFLIYVSSISAYIVPKRAFKPEESKDMFFQFITNKKFQKNT